MDSTDEEGYPVLILDSLITGNKAGMCQTPLPRSHPPHPHRRLMTNLGGSAAGSRRRTTAHRFSGSRVIVIAFPGLS